MYEFLKKVPLFAELPEADLRQLCEQVVEVRLPAGTQLFAEGAPGDKAYVIKEGELEILKASSGREVLLAVRRAGEVIGEMALLEEVPRMASVRASTDSVLIAIQKEHLDELLNTSLSAARALFSTLLARWRNTMSSLRQSEKMAQLGTLTAGVSHELNNPASAVRRGAGTLHAELDHLVKAQSALNHLELTPIQQGILQEYIQSAQAQAKHPPNLDALSRSDQELELEDWLDANGVQDAWEFAPYLVNINLGTQELDSLAGSFPNEQLTIVLDWLCANYTVHTLVTEIEQGATRISEIISALKSYSYLDQAPVQNVDIHAGLDNTLVILQNKLKQGVNVHREYTSELPKIQAYGSELNQVWTNIIDNAIDAMDGQGEIAIRTRQEKDWVLVEIEDNGPGIPVEIQERIFDPFFTTKSPGAGTGLGLDISYRIVVHKHRGDIQVSSQPGKTCFQVWLPIHPDANPIR